MRSGPKRCGFSEAYYFTYTVKQVLKMTESENSPLLGKCPVSQAGQQGIRHFYIDSTSWETMDSDMLVAYDVIGPLQTLVTLGQCLQFQNGVLCDVVVLAILRKFREKEMSFIW